MRSKVAQQIGLMLLPIVLVAAMARVPSAAAQVQVVNMIPNAMSDESNRDSEPYLTVNPANPQLMAATAFLLTPAGSSNGPLLVSTDGGITWVAQNVIPSSPGGLNTFDVTIHFNSAGDAFYAGLLRDSTAQLEIQRTTDLTFATPLVAVNTPQATDQPYTFARTVTGWFDAGKDRVWVTNNEGAANPASATVDQSLDAAIIIPAFTQIRIDADMPVGRDNYQVRTVAHPDGHVYAAFYRRKGTSTGGYNADVVVVRDDNWGNAMSPFRNLTDSTTTVPGQNVVTSTPVSDTFGSSATLGNEWWGGDLYLTIDPNNSARVYISYSDSKTGADRTLHLRRSTDSGQTWDPDLLTTASAKNAAIAVNSHGTIAYLYQLLSGTSPNLRWQTHLRRSTNDGTTWDDVTLADFPAQGTGSPGGSRIIGDYLNMVAMGKNFYGVFSSYNDLANATFPVGVTWARNTTPPGSATPHLLGLDGTTIITPSIDSFFFRTTEIDPDKDLYVRDWTDSPPQKDHGQEPSVRINFFSTSDVWNRRSDDPQPFNVNDQPQVEDPQPVAIWHNFAFSRVSREATGSAANSTLSYLYSDGGVGVNYVSTGAATSMSLGTGDAAQTPVAGSGYQWDLPDGSSNHVCLAVEISTSEDPLLSPSLLGHAPGWPTTDLMIVADNNKAQRNMQVFGFGGMSGESTGASRMTMYTIAHNASTTWRDMQIGVEISPTVLRQFKQATLRVVGRDKSPDRLVQPHDAFTLPKMAPGENRWLELSFTPQPGAHGEFPVGIYEIVSGRPVNGYAFIPKSMPLEQAIRATLQQHAAVFTRLGAAFKTGGAKRQAELALKFLSAERVAPVRYLKFVREDARAMASTASAFLSNADMHDPFNMVATIKALTSASSASTAQSIHLTLLNKLDAAQTMQQKANGDAADIPQNVRWQRDLLGQLQTPHSREAVEASSKFLLEYEHRKSGIEEFGPLLTSLEVALKEASERDPTGEAAHLLDEISRGTSPAALQKVHREFLLALDRENQQQCR
jgi:hypothetical protein